LRNGSVESAITPTSVMTMLMTPAKIGRSMKEVRENSCRPPLRLRRHFSFLAIERRFSLSPFRWQASLPVPA
jgi:hypothetical protein